MELDKEELEATRNRKGCGIEKLEMIEDTNFWRFPNNEMLMNKINEIIDYLDRKLV